jgi:hypothetical protein
VKKCMYYVRVAREGEFQLAVVTAARRSTSEGRGNTSKGNKLLKIDSRREHQKEGATAREELR